jgi:hypothetical protein
MPTKLMKNPVEKEFDESQNVRPKVQSMTMLATRTRPEYLTDDLPKILAWLGLTWLRGA